MEQEKKCENCKHFCLHYVKTRISFITLSEGHCTNGENPWKVRKCNLPCDSVCEKWESNEGVKKERKEKIEKVLKDMRTTLIHIENILKDDLNTD